MGFESGSISFRMFLIPRNLPDDIVSRFAKHAVPPLGDVTSGQLRGWVTGRHLLDRNITEETAYYGSYLRLSLLTAQKKVPASLLGAECRMEELAQEAAAGHALNRKQRTEIREAIVERLLPQMPPQLSGIPFVFHDHSGTVFASALSTAQSDLFATYFGSAAGFTLIPGLPDQLAFVKFKADSRDWYPSSFSPDIPNDIMQVNPGQEFLTWLWFASEMREGQHETDIQGAFSYMLEGPLTFELEAAGAFETIIRKGEPLLSAEAKTCLLSGKKLKRAKLTLAQGDQVWTVTVDADEFVFRGLKLPDAESSDPVGRFQERMVFLDAFRDMFLGLYQGFLEERNDSKRWKNTVNEMQQWAKSRKGRR